MEHPITPPPDELAELVARLKAIRNDYGVQHSADCQRAAELLERTAIPPPEPPTEQKSSIDELIAGCTPLDPDMELTTEARWQLFGEQDSATPPPEPPTDMEIAEWADACSEAPLEEPDPEAYGWRRCFTAEEFSETIRAALERWGHR